MTEFENKVLQELAGINQRLDGMDKRLDGHDKQFESIDNRFDHIDHRFDLLEQRLGRIEKSQMSIATMAELLPKLVYMVDDLHNDFLERKGLLRKEE